jgi:hypothetical protein
MYASRIAFICKKYYKADILIIAENEELKYSVMDE